MRRRGQLLAATAAVVAGLMTPLSAVGAVSRTVVAEGVDRSAPTREVSPDTTVQFRIVLRPERQEALDALLVAQRDPHSPYFHRYLQPGAFAREFAPSRQSIDNLISYFSTF